MLLTVRMTCACAHTTCHNALQVSALADANEKVMADLDSVMMRLGDVERGGVLVDGEWQVSCWTGSWQWHQALVCRGIRYSSGTQTRGSQLIKVVFGSQQTHEGMSRFEVCCPASCGLHVREGCLEHVHYYL